MCGVCIDQLMMTPASSAVGEGGSRNWLSPQGDRGFKVEIETGVVEMRSNLKPVSILTLYCLTSNTAAAVPNTPSSPPAAQLHYRQMQFSIPSFANAACPTGYL